MDSFEFENKMYEVDILDVVDFYKNEQNNNELKKPKIRLNSSSEENSSQKIVIRHSTKAFECLVRTFQSGASIDQVLDLTGFVIKKLEIEFLDLRVGEVKSKKCIEMKRNTLILEQLTNIKTGLNNFKKIYNSSSSVCEKISNQISNIEKFVSNIDKIDAMFNLFIEVSGLNIDNDDINEKIFKINSALNNNVDKLNEDLRELGIISFSFSNKHDIYKMKENTRCIIERINNDLTRVQILNSTEVFNVKKEEIFINQYKFRSDEMKKIINDILKALNISEPESNRSTKNQLQGSSNALSTTTSLYRGESEQLQNNLSGLEIRIKNMLTIINSSNSENDSEMVGENNDINKIISEIDEINRLTADLKNECTKSALHLDSTVKKSVFSNFVRMKNIFEELFKVSKGNPVLSTSLNNVICGFDEIVLIFNEKQHVDNK